MKMTALSLMIFMATATANAESVSGEDVYDQWCVHCHSPDPSMPGRLKLEWSRGKEQSRIDQRTDLDAAYIRRIVRQGQAEMPSFRATEISEADLDALIAWLNRPR